MRTHLLRRSVLALAVTLGMLVLTPSPSWACSCAIMSTAQHVAQAGTVAAGTVAWTATDGQKRTYQVAFDQVYKGAAASSEKLVTQASEAACGLANLAPGKRYLFFIDGVHPGSMRVGLCGGTAAYDAATARQVEAITGPPSQPIAPAVDPSAERTGDGRTTLFVALAVGALLVVVAVVGAVGVRRRPA